jgi:WD40 repeat protein
VAFSPDGRWLATSIGVNSPVTLWDAGGASVVTFNPEQEVVFDIAFSPDGRRLATAGLDGTVKLWSVSDGSPIATINAAQGRLFLVAFTPDGGQLYTYSRDDNTTALWNLVGQEKIATAITDPDHSPEVAFGPAGPWIASPEYNSKVKLWDGKVNLWDASGKRVATIDTQHQQQYRPRIVLSPDGQRMATIGGDGKVKLWDAKGKLIDTIDLQKGQTETEVAFGPHGPWFATIEGDGKVKLWDAKGNLTATLNTHQAGFHNVVLSPDCQRLALRDRSKVDLWDLKGKLIATNTLGDKANRGAFISSVAFSPDGQRLATGGSEGTVQVRDIKRDTITTIHTRQGDILALQFSPDGRWLATCGQLNDSVNLWDAHGNIIATLNTRQTYLEQVAFSPDGQSLATIGSSGDGHGPDMVKLWQIGREKELVIRSCKELSDYLNDPNAVVSDSDRHLCDGIGTQK